MQRTWRLIQLGPPGIGKGTQAELLARALGASPLAPGDIFHAASGKKLVPGSILARARTCLDGGEPVSDDIILALVRERCRRPNGHGGFILKGFPRNRRQALMVDELLAAEFLALDAVLHYELPAAALMDRITGRRVCPNCSAVFHLTGRPPVRAGICDHCDGTLGQRTEDRPAAVRERLAACAADTAPLLPYYREKHLLISIDAGQRPEEIFAHTLDALVALVLPA